MIRQLQKTAHSLGLAFNARPKTYNSRLAQELGLWAEDQGHGDAFHMTAFHAYFADGINLALIPELLTIAEKSGLKVDEAKQVLAYRSYKQRVDQDWADSRLKAVTAVPTFIMGQHKLTGAQNYEVFEELMTLYKVPSKKLIVTRKLNQSQKQILEGNLISLAQQGRFDVIVHGCNCFCTMGAGIAYTIQKQFPEAYAADLMTNKGDRNKLGFFSSATITENGHDITIVNGYTQFHHSGPVPLVDYNAVENLFRRIKKEFSGKHIAYPRIGAGLAGGDWNRIEQVIDQELAGERHTLVNYLA